jgi:hypothetical protein
MPIEVKHLGLQPKAEMTTDLEKTTLPDGTNVYSPVYKAEMVDTTEWVATGKEVHDPEFAKLTADSTVASEHEDWRRESIFGTDKISTPDGLSEIRARNDQIQMLRGQGYGVKPRTTRMVVPELAWHKERKRMYGKTIVKYRDGRRLVLMENGLKIERTEG